MLRVWAALLSLLCVLCALSAPAAAHDLAMDAESGMEAGVHYVGAYPIAPGAAAAGSFTIPQSAIVGGQLYDCVAIINNWNVLAANKMYGVAVYRDGNNVIRGVHTRSGEPTYNAPSNPVALQGNNIGQIASWTAAVVTQADRAAIANDLTALFNAPRKCFGLAPAAATCQYVNSKIRRTWPAPPQGVAPAAEVGAPSGVCALTRIAIHLHNQGIPRANIICAAERTHQGWNGGQTSAGVAVNYGAGEIVSSCVTCQQQVPIILGSDCRNIVAPPYGGLGTCNARLLDGESCAFTCQHGAPIPAVATCLNGVFAGSFCPAPPVALAPNAQQQQQPLRRANSVPNLRKIFRRQRQEAALLP